MSSGDEDKNGDESGDSGGDDGIWCYDIYVDDYDADEYECHDCYCGQIFQHIGLGEFLHYLFFKPIFSLILSARYLHIAGS